MKRFFIVHIMLFFSSVGLSQDNFLQHYEKQITSEIILKHLQVLASDSLEGRETAERGMIKASNYVSEELKKSGLLPANGSSYYQDVSFMVNNGASRIIYSETDTFKPGDDYYSSDLTTIDTLLNLETVFAGYGIIDSTDGWNDYSGIDVKNKVVIILDGEPLDKQGNPVIKKTDSAIEWTKNRKRKIQIARDKKATAIFYVNRKLSFGGTSINKWVTDGSYLLKDNIENVNQPVIHISDKMADKLFNNQKYKISDFEKQAYKRKQRAKYHRLPVQDIYIRNSSQSKNCRNVAGIVEGNENKGEFLIISAHLDHLGVRGSEIYNGADDDGSGCATVLTLAEIFASAAAEGNRPKRSIVFLFFTAEEKGLLGSEYYVKNPLVPLDSTIADLNIDMIGRVDTVSRASKYYTYIIGSDRMSRELHNINETANKNCCNLQLDYTYNDPAHRLKLYERSDHYNFVQHNIPVIFYFTGLHEDYHKPSDTIDKVDIEKTTAIARLIFNTAWQLANRSERPAIDKTE